MRTVQLLAELLLMGALAASCHRGTVEPPPASDLARGGVYVAYNLGCDEGCRDVERGDVILAVDGKPVDTRQELLAARLTEERPIALDVVRAGETSPRRVTIVAEPNDDFEPLTDVPPFWTVGAEALDRAPDWARSPMFSHAVAALALVHVDGGWMTGRDLYGKKTIVVVWPDLPLYEKQYWNFRDQMATFYGVLQKAQGDLKDAEVGIVFAVCGGSNDTTVRRELEEMGQTDAAGNPMPMLPVYRCPSLSTGPLSSGRGGVQAFGNSPARHVGLEHSGQSFFDYVRGFPVIAIVDQGGIVRWHSSGYHEGPQKTILGAVMFAMHALDERP